MKKKLLKCLPIVLMYMFTGLISGLSVDIRYKGLILVLFIEIFLLVSGLLCSVVLSVFDSQPKFGNRFSKVFVLGMCLPCVCYSAGYFFMAVKPALIS